MCEPLITWAYEQYLLVLSFVCCETVIIGRCATELDLSHPLELQSTLQQRTPPHDQLHVACATLPPNVFISQVYVLSDRNGARVKRCHSIVKYYFKYLRSYHQQTHHGCILPVQFTNTWDASFYTHAYIIYITTYIYFLFKKNLETKKQTENRMGTHRCV